MNNELQHLQTENTSERFILNEYILTATDGPLLCLFTFPLDYLSYVRNPKNLNEL